MSPENQAKLDTLKIQLDAVMPLLKVFGLTRMPTVDQLHEKAKERTDNEEAQLEYIAGYLKGAGMVCGSMDTINKAARTFNTHQSVTRETRGWLERLFGF